MNAINWAQLLAGACLALIVAVVLVDPIKAFRDRAFTRLRRVLRRLRRALGSAEGKARELFTFGDIRTSWMVLDGDGQDHYVAVTCTRVQPTRELPEDLKELKAVIAAEQTARRQRGESAHWNGETLALDAYSHERTTDKELPILHLRFKTSDYFNFLATSLSLDRMLPEGQTVRAKYLRPPDWTNPSRCLSTSFGINVALVTADHKLVVIRRGKDVGSMPGAYGTSINEGLNVADNSPTGPDVQMCGRRGAMEELGYDLAKEDIQFLSLGVDTTLAQWGLLGIARAKTSTYEEVVSARAQGAKDKFETDTMHGVDFTPEAVGQFVRDHPVWAPGGLACVYHALINEHGRREVERALRRQSRKTAANPVK